MIDSTSSEPQITEADVVIVGGGPVGMGLAIELGQRGVRCAVVEQYSEPPRIPKGQNLTQRTMEHFHFWGTEKELREARTIPREYGIGGLTAYGKLLGSYSYDWLQRELVRPYYFQDNERLPQYSTEAVLRRRAAALPTVQTYYGCRAEAVAQDEHGVSVTVAERDGTRCRTLRASFLIGCDGSRSFVREQAGITQTVTDHGRLMVLLVFRSLRLHELLERFPGKSYYNVLQPELDGYWKFFGRVDLGTTWFFHAPVPPGTTADNFDFPSYLHEAVGAEFDVHFEYIGFWDLRFAIADRYRAGRVFIAGDAAHSHPPYGGYGVNTGFEDARNLGWKLAGALQRWAGPQLLDSYETERRPVFQSTARDFIAKAIETDRDFLHSYAPEKDRDAFEHKWAARGSGAVGEVNAFEPHYEGSPIVCNGSGVGATGCSAVGRHSFAARPGHHLAPAVLSSGRNVYEKLGNDYALLGFNANEGTLNRFADEARRMRIPLTIVKDHRKGDCARYDAELVLVRPDHFVAWASGSVPANFDPTPVLQVATGRQSSPPIMG